jgi:hypothetical protein
MNKRMPYLIVFAFLLSACNRVIYYGRTYPPTTDVEIYFRESDVKQPHEIMGKVVYEVTAKKRSEKVQDKLLRKSKKHGADAIIFDDISLTRTGSNTSGGGGGVGLKRGFLGIFGARTRYAKGQQIKGTLLKYQK